MTAYTSVFNTPPSGTNFLIGDTVTLTGGDVWKYAGNGQWAADQSDSVKVTVDPVTGGIRLSAGGVPIIDDNPQFQKNEVIALIGDSITEASALTFKWVQGASGYYRKKEWLTPGADVSSAALPTLNISGYTSPFVESIRGNTACANSDTFVVEYDGVSKMRVNIASEGFGAWVDISSGGWFEFLSAGGVKGILSTIRFYMRPPGAATGSGSFPASHTVQTCNVSLGSLYFPALAQIGYATADLYCFGIVSDSLSAIKTRNSQVVALAPTLALIHASINDFLNFNLADLATIVRDLNAVGTRCVVSTVLPYNGMAAATTANQYAKMNDAILNITKTYPELSVVVIDGASQFIDPYATSGAGIITSTDYIADGTHPHACSVINKFTPVAVKALSKLLPVRRPVVSGSLDAYHATYNPRGNRMGAPMLGTTGTLGTGPVATGSLPTGWTDDNDGGTLPAWASVVHTAPQGAGAVARGDGVPGNWHRMQLNTASASGSSRRMKWTLTDTFTGDSTTRYKIHATVRLKDTTFLQSFQVFLQFRSASGRLITSYAVLNCGFAGSLIGQNIVDSGALYLSSDAIAIPSDFNGLAFVWIYVQCGNGGSADIYLADISVKPE